MKKKIMSLMMGASLFVSTQVVAMDPEKENDKPTIIKTGQKEYQTDNKKAILNIIFDSVKPNFGDFDKISKGPIKIVLSLLNEKSFLEMSQTSKAFYQLCASHPVSIEISRNHFFFHENISYSMPIYKFLKLTKNANSFEETRKDVMNIEGEWEIVPLQSNMIYEFTLGKKRFRLHDKGNTGDHMMYELPADSLITFIWKDTLNFSCKPSQDMETFKEILLSYKTLHKFSPLKGEDLDKYMNLTNVNESLDTSSIGNSKCGWFCKLDIYKEDGKFTYTDTQELDTNVFKMSGTPHTFMIEPIEKNNEEKK